MSKNNTLEDAVRSYLMALKDPSRLIDTAAVNKLTAELGNTTDPISRLELQQQLLNAQNPAVHTLEATFIEHAKTWADGVGIAADALAREGVARDVLRLAGFGVRARKKAPAGRRTSVRRITANDVAAAIPTGPFTVKTLAVASGASTAVARKVIAAGLADGTLVEKGIDNSHSSRGRAPTLYGKA